MKKLGIEAFFKKARTHKGLKLLYKVSCPEFEFLVDQLEPYMKNIPKNSLIII
jgi:hypothetical protein